jgi:DNA-directed RNA polymerase subunit RPC12/RpoP
MCVDPCPEDERVYARSSDNTCAECGEECEKCVEDLTKDEGYRCTECTPPMLLHGDSCVYECSGYITEDPTECHDCTWPCDMCISETECLSCLPDAGYLYDLGCVDPCPAGYW